MPMSWMSVSVSSSHSSMCEEATRISCGPLRVPGTYDVVRSRGIGRMTTRARSKGAAGSPANSPMATWSNSNGRFIHFLETVARDRLAVDGHGPLERERRLAARGEDRFGGSRERGGEHGQRDGGVGLHRDLVGVGRQLAPALRLLEARSGGAAEVR